MAFVVKTAKTLRNHWKKSTFGFVVLSYSVSSLKTRYDTNVFMRARCEEAMKYGEELLPLGRHPRSVTIILNPAANKRKAKTEYEKFCEPLFHLAGISVNLLQTNSEGHAKELIETVPANETIVVAGGDGTLSETITGMLRKEGQIGGRTVGVIPLGRRNYLGNKLFPPGKKANRVHQLTDATMAIIKNETFLQDVMKIESIETDAETPAKPIFAIGPIEWGAFRDALSRRDKYWIYGSLRDYATFIFNGYKSSLCWECKGTLKITPPCDGCNNCRQDPVLKPKGFSWSNFIMPKAESKDSAVKYSQINNEDCRRSEELCFKTTQIDIIPMRKSENEPPHLALAMDKMGLGYFEFIQEGWNKVKKPYPDIVKPIKARSIELLPLKPSQPGSEVWFNIDNEEFDVRPIKITLLPDAIKMYCNNKN